jgi:hypothetical protein
MRTTGIAIAMNLVPTGSLAEEAKQRQQQKQERAEASAAKRQAAYDNAPNTLCYKDTAFKDWKPGDAIPECIKCRGKLYPTEHHVCTGVFVPKFRTKPRLPLEERRELHRAAWEEAGDWDDDQYDSTTPDETTNNLRMQHEAETGETCDQVVIEGMTEEEYLMKKFGYIPSFEDFEED